MKFSINKWRGTFMFCWDILNCWLLMVMQVRSVLVEDWGWELEVGRDGGGGAPGWGLATALPEEGRGVMDESLQALATLPALPAWPASPGCTPRLPPFLDYLHSAESGLARSELASGAWPDPASPDQPNTANKHTIGIIFLFLRFSLHLT